MIVFIYFFAYLFQIKSFFDIPKISIIVPIYNVNKYLRQCLNSLVNQTLKNIEIICINDGSTDNSLEIIMEYMIDNRIIIINKSNSGYGNSMNQGIDFVSGKYIGIVESDDFVDINMFGFLYNFTENGNIDIVRSDYFAYFNEHEINPVKFNIINSIYNKTFNPIEFPNIFLININIWAEIYKKDLIIKNKIRFLSTPGASFQDTSFFFKTLFKSKKIFYLNKPFYYYRQTNLNSSVKITNLNKIIFILKEFHEIENYFHKDLKLFNEIKKYYYSKKIRSLLWNLIRVDKKKEYIKLLYQEIYDILKDDNYFHYLFNKYETIFLNYLLDYGYEITSYIYLNTLNYNISKPKISVIIPIYNSEEFIEECLNSLIKQTFKNFEIICINDGSTDNSLKLLKIYEKLDDRIHIFTQNNSGPAVARNIGMNISKGDYIIFLDSDDIFEDTMIEELFARIYAYNNEIVICNSKNFVIIKGQKIYNQNKNYYISNDIIKNKTRFSSFDIKKDFLSLFIWWPWDKIFKKDFIKNLGIEYQNLRTSEDLFFVAAAVIKAKNLSFIDKIFINHRMGVNSSVSNSRNIYWNNFYYALKKLKNFIKENGLYKRFKQDFINYVAKFSIWNLETIQGDSFCKLYQKLKNEWWIEFGISKFNKNYFYNKKIYKKVKYIMKYDLINSQILYEKENNENLDLNIDINENYLFKQKNYCKLNIKNKYNKKYKIISFIYNINYK
jgi:glycosyltransferase involved in cell wall biosynthesis